MDVKSTWTQAGAAKRLGVTTSTISIQIRRGIIRTVATADGLKLIPTSELKRYAKRQLKNSRGAKRVGRFSKFK